jgi:hypothetical protein
MVNLDEFSRFIEDARPICPPDVVHTSLVGDDETRPARALLH